MTDDTKKTEKRPYTSVGAAVHGFFHAMIDPLDKAIEQIGGRVTRYQRQVAETERLRAEAEAEARLKEAQLAEATAETPEEEAEVDELLQASDDARKRAEAKAATRSMSRTTHGASGSLTTRWVHTIEKPAQIPLAKLRPYIDTGCLDKAIRGYIKAGGRDLKGVRIYEEHKTRFRG